MLYLIIVTLSNDGTTKEIIIPTNEIIKANLLNIVNSYENVIRVELSYIISNRKIFSTVIKDKYINDIEHIKLFNCFGASGTQQLQFMSVGYIDTKRNIRVEYMNDGIKLYYL